MPYSLLLQCYIKNEVYPVTQKHLHAMFLHIVNQVTPDLATILHQESKNKSFTLCLLEQKENEIWWRLTLLDDCLFKPFSNILFKTSEMELYLGKNSILIASILCSPLSGHPLANFTLYPQIADSASKEIKTFKFCIMTPLAFKTGDGDLPLPVPKLFFTSLHKRWETYSDIKFNFDNFEPLIEQHVFISSFNLKSKEFFDGRAVSVGTVGDVTFNARGKISPELIHYLNVLSDYAYYAGVGKKTTMGMGQVKRIGK